MAVVGDLCCAHHQSFIKLFRCLDHSQRLHFTGWLLVRRFALIRHRQTAFKYVVPCAALGLQGVSTAMEKWHRKLGDKDVGGVLASEIRSRGWAVFGESHVFKEGFVSRIIASRHAAAMISG